MYKKSIVVCNGDVERVVNIGKYKVNIMPVATFLNKLWNKEVF